MKIIKREHQDHFPERVMQVNSVTADEVQCYKMGGGFVIRIPTSELHHYDIVDESRFDNLSWRPAFFEVADFRYAGFTDGDAWNGWATPVFTKQVAIQIAKDLDSPDERLAYDESLDAFTSITPDSEKPYLIEGFPIVVGAETFRVYGLGSGSWCWEESVQ